MPELPYANPLLGDEAVLLRPFEGADVAAVAAICRDPEIARWTSVPEPYTEKDAREYFARAEQDRREGRELSHALVDFSSGKLLGSMGLMVNSEHATGEVGYYLAAEARGRGLATRALRLLSRWGIEQLGLARIEVLAHPDNMASQRVAQRAGFQREGLLRSYRDRKGERDDLLMFSLLRHELEPR
jgi:RimJ/RimL family protein N-acetyltransferase